MQWLSITVYYDFMKTTCRIFKFFEIIIFTLSILNYIKKLQFLLCRL